MKASFRVRPDLTVEVEGETHKDLFRELAGVCEVFGEQTCGLCGGAEIVPAFRTVGQGKKTFEYPEWHCQGCGARLSLGSMMEGGRLFPHRKLDSAGKPDREHGTFGAHHGWTLYRGEPKDDAPPRGPAARASRVQAEPPNATITEGQWKDIQAELKKHLISDRAFLKRYGYSGPREIMVPRFAELLAAAKNPDAELRGTKERGAGRAKMTVAESRVARHLILRMRQVSS